MMPLLAPDPTARRLVVLGTVSLLLYAGVCAVSFSFQYDAGDPPVLEAVAGLAVTTCLYVIALALVLRRRVDAGLMPIIWGFALAYRLVLMPSLPIQEIDYYRYLWDGRVTLNGLNPYRYAPFQIEDAGPDAAADSELGRAWAVSCQSEAVQSTFARVHHRGVPTVYPPLAQAVFALSAAVVPVSAPLAWHVLALKVVLVGFDLGTIAVLAALLRRLLLPASWCLAYAWCPLVLKELANSAHLDSVAVFFSTLALFLLVPTARGTSSGRVPGGAAFAAMVALGLAVLAKTYPVVLLPVVGAYLLGRLRWRAVGPLLVFPVVVVLGYVPFAEAGRSKTPSPAGSLAAAEDAPMPHNPGTGLGTFLTQWESNDLLFMVVYQNLHAPTARPAPWFVVVPAAWRDALNRELLEPAAGRWELPNRVNPAFVLAQGLLGVVLLGLCGWWAWGILRAPSPGALLRGAFLTLAWGWLLSSAPNPWYLMWCLPVMVFARRRSWFLLPGLVLLYYVGFWLERNGSGDAIERWLVWLEFVPFFAACALETLWRREQPQRAEPDRGPPEVESSICVAKCCG